MNVFELFGTIAIDGTKANGTLDKISQNARAAGKTMQNAFSKIGSASVKVGKTVAGAGIAVGGAWVAAIEGTRDYRTAMAKLDTAFTTNGHSAEAAKRTYQDLQAVLGETDQSVEAANHLAVMCETEEELQKWTDICTGIFATFGDSLPIEGLTESANETAKVGQVTGTLADALNWAGISEEDFNLKLRACRTEQERQELIMNHLNSAYKNASDQYKKNAEDIMKANRAQESWNSAMAALGAIGEPILTTIKQKTADMVLAAVPHLENFITKFREIENVWTEAIWPLVQSTFKVAFGIDVPEWSVIESTITTWWTGTAKPALDGIFKTTFGIDPPEWSAIPEAITAWWTGTAKPVLDGIFKTTFGIDPPEWSAIPEAITAWWTGTAKPALDGIFEAVVGLDTQNTDDDGTPWITKLGTWFNGIMASRGDMFKLTVGLLMHDTDETGQRWSIAIADWFHAMVGEIGEQLKITFSVLMPTPEETAKIQNDVTAWLHGSDGKSGIVGLIANAIALPFDLAFQECVNVWEEFQKWLASVSETGKINTETYEESEWAKGAKYDYRLWGYTQDELAVMQKWIDAVQGREALDFTSTEDEVKAVENAVASAWDAVEALMGKDGAQQILSDYQSWLGGQLGADNGLYLDIPLSLKEGTADELQTDINGLGLEAPVKLVPDYSGLNSVSSYGRSLAGRVIPTSMIAGSHATGLDFVPRDNYIANLHKGEAVLTSSEAALWRSGAMGGDVGRLEAAINSLGVMLKQISANTAGGHQVVLDSGILVGQMAPAMDNKLGAISGRKGRRN